MYTCVYACVCIYIYINTNTNTINTNNDKRYKHVLMCFTHDCSPECLPVSVPANFGVRGGWDVYVYM